MSDDSLSCPLCGKEVWYEYEDGDDGFVVIECNDCVLSLREWVIVAIENWKRLTLLLEMPE